MSELRAPDPTLDAGEPTALIGLDYGHGDPLIGHLVRWVDLEHVPECADPEFGGVEVIAAKHARWLAVPCRECFPDAPAPGHVWSRYVLGRQADIEPYLFATQGLAWQVSS